MSGREVTAAARAALASALGVEGATISCSDLIIFCGVVSNLGLMFCRKWSMGGSSFHCRQALKQELIAYGQQTGALVEKQPCGRSGIAQS